MRKPTHKILNGLVALAMALAAVVTAHAATVNHSSAASLPTFRVVNWVSPDLALASTLDPAQVTDVYASAVINDIQAGLVQLNSRTQVQKNLATKIKLSKNHKSYTFTIRSAKFSNGDPVTAQDFVYSIRRALAHKTASPVNYYDSLITGYAKYTAGTSSRLGVKAINAHTLQINISKPAPYFLDALAYANNDVLDPKVEKAHNAGTAKNYMTEHCAANVGAGPFKMVCAGKGAGPSSFYHGTHQYTLVPNPNYFGPKPKIKLELTVAGTSETAYNEYLAGQVDAVGVPSDHLSKYLHKKNAQFHDVLTSAISYTSLNTTAPPFNNSNCRKAYAYGINRVDMAKVIKYENRPYYEILPSAFLGYFKPSGVPTDNMAKAKTLFAACGAAGKTAFKLVYAAGGSDSDKIADTEAATAKAIGFNETAEPLQLNDWDSVITQALSKTGTIAVEQGW
ncbi:MAG: ABC transporter substrate-binding protein, partial [Chloroflexota bacterium]